MARFVILVHDHPHLHWDLMWEEPSQEKLRTWRLEQPPTEGILVAATPLGDHRRIYLDYEGPVSGNRGEVKRWDSGDADVLSHDEGQIELRLLGTKIHGIAVLAKTQAAEWTLRFMPEAKDGQTRPNA